MEITYFYYNQNSLKNKLRKNKQLYGEEFAKFIHSDKKLKIITTFVIANALMIQKAIAETPPDIEDSLGKIDAAGGTFLLICRRFAYWLCLIMCIIEILRSLMQGDTKSIGKVIFKYVLAFATLYFMPWLFNIIKSIF